MDRANGLEVKKVNRNRIFQLVYNEGPVSRQNISYKLRVSLPTVSHNLKRLKEAGLIIDSETFDSTGGRKAKGISLNPMARTAIGIDITKNHVVLVAVDLKANVISNMRMRLPFENKTAYFSTLGTEVQRFIESTGLDASKILGVGISIPSLLSTDNLSVEYSRVIDFMGGRLERFSEHIPYKCVLSNDASAAGLAEFWNTKGVENMIYLSLSNSVGGAILLNDTFYPGNNQRSGEFGHITIVPEGRQCYCGQSGCVDAYCSASILSDSTEGNLPAFFELLANNSPVHKKIWDEYLGYLLLTINNLRMSFDCRVVLGGYVGAMLDDYIGTIRDMASKRNSFAVDGGYVEVCRYKLESSAVGAALLHIKQFVNNI